MREILQGFIMKNATASSGACDLSLHSRRKLVSTPVNHAPQLAAGRSVVASWGVLLQSFVRFSDVLCLKGPSRVE